MAAATETFTRPQRRIKQDTSETFDDDESQIASINAMTINVGNDDDEDYNAKSAYNTSNGAQGGKTTATHTSSTGASSNTSSLRSLLGVPPKSNGIQRSLQAGGNQSSGAGSTMLGVPPSTSSRTAPAGIGGASGAVIGGGSNDIETLPSEIAPKRRKVVLGPGCSALDWARLKSSIPSKGFRKIKPSELKLHKSNDDAWSAFNGKVYDITPYMRFHPGGQNELMRVAGRDGTRLFMLTHSWVNIDSMIDSCVIGVLVSESS